MRFIKGHRSFLAVVIIVASYGFIIYKIIELPFLVQLKFVFAHTSDLFYLCLLIQIGLLVINFSIESLKWKNLLLNIVDVSFVDSVKMVLSGYSSGIFTPSKLGEPIGRLMYLEKKLWTKGVAMNYFGGFIQNIIILVIGLISGLILFIDSADRWLITVIWYGIYIALLIVALYIGFIFFEKAIKKNIRKLKWANILKEMYDIIHQISLKRLSWLIFLCLSRFLVYSFQLFVFIYLLGDVVDVASLSLLIPLYFLTVTIIPSFIFSDLGVRNSVALLLFAGVCLSDASIMLSVSVLWFINHAVPAIFGSFFIYKRGKAKHKL